MSSLPRPGHCAVQVLTFDFHNTIANCDPWFALEVRDLPWAVIEHLGLVAQAPARAEIDQAYRELRLEVIASGNEIDAYASVRHLFDRFGLHPGHDSIKLAVDSLMEECLSALVPVPGAVDTVRQLRDAGVRLGVVSSAVHHLTLEWILERLGIAGCFDAVVTSASSGFYKSSPAIYETAMRELGGTPSQCVHVGDSLRWDVATAQQAGMHAVWLNTERKEVFASALTEPVTPALELDTLVDAGQALLSLLARVRMLAHA